LHQSLGDGIAGGGPGRLSRIDAFVTAETARQRIPGVAIAVVKNGRVQASTYRLNG
jgi:hypothetical protein